MKYALKDEQRIEASPKERAACPICRSNVIAKCGARRIPHWAHEGLRNCDSWKEAETQWHRDWKNKFPVACQEHVQHDENGERHIADVRTKHGLVLEFQHSPIDPKEREARERFHKNIFWVVDGTRLKLDFPRFQKGLRTFQPAKWKNFFLVPEPKECFPGAWLSSPAHVFFDFLGVGPASSPDPMRESLWQLLPNRLEGKAVVAAVSRAQFIEFALNGPPAPIPAPAIQTNPQKSWRPLGRRHFRF